MRSKIITTVLVPVLLHVGIGLAPDARAQEEAAGAERPHAWLTTGALTTENYSEGIGDIVIPLHFNGSGLWFLNPRFSFTDRSAEEYNIGLGYRHLLSDGQAIGGLNVFYDHRETSLGGSFGQIGMGGEYLTHWVDLRANVYLPLDRKELVNEFTTVEESSSRSTTVSTAVEWDDPFATGHDIYQGFDVVRSVQTRTTTMTTTRHFREYELALRGWDAEIGVRLPLEQIEDHVRFKTFAGYYKYYGREGLDDVDGFRGRVEIHIKPSFFVDAVYYADDALNGGNYSIGAYVSLPFDLANIANGRNPFEGASERWDTDKNPADMRHRLTDMVKRDPQIRSLISEPEEDEAARTTSTRSATRTDRTKVGDGTEEVATDITFVDGDFGDDANPGTFEEPKATVQGGVNDPRSMVFVFQEGNPYFENVVLTDNVILRGEGAPIQAFGGRTFGSGVHPRIDGGGFGPTITMAANTTVQGFRINNTSGGVPAGHGIFSATGENLVIADNIIHETVNGVFVDTVGDVAVNLLNNRFRDNISSAALINGVGASGSYFVNAQNNVFEGGGPFGLRLEANNYDSVFAIVNGLEAYDHVFGMYADLNAEFASLLSLSDVDAYDNLFGVQASLSATNGIAALLGGLPPELMSFVSDIIGGGPLPPELEALLASSGPIRVNNNDVMGLDLDVQGNFLSALVLFDVEASGNGVMGVDADVGSTNSLISLALVGSSENFLNTLQLLGGLLGAAPGDLPSTSTGYSRFNGNGVMGLDLDVEADFLALSAGMGIQANNNGVFGVDVETLSPSGLALSFLSRIEANDNGVMGINSVTEGDFLGLAALLDTHTSGNGVFGVNLDVSGDVAIGLMASTDPFRTLIDLLDPSMSLPGTPFGPVIASDNGVMGVNANINGEFLALGAFLDVHATGNDLFGIDAFINSDDGTAIGLFASSDQLFDVLFPLLGGPVPTFTPMGPMDLSGNGGGLAANINGEFGAIGLVAGVDASNNTDDIGPGFGILFNVDSNQGDALALLLNSRANNNALYGVNLNVTADELAGAFIGNTQARNNGLHGFLINVDSDSSDAFLNMAGVTARNNGLQGIFANVSADRDVGVALTGVHANWNKREGMVLNVDAGHDALVLLGSDALDEFGGFGFLGADLAALGFASTGPSSFDFNGYDSLSPGPRAGATFMVNAQEEILVSVSDANFGFNSGDGARFELESAIGPVTLNVADVLAMNNNGNGIFFDAISVSGPSDVMVIIEDSSVLGNGTDVMGEVETDAGAAGIFLFNVNLSSWSLGATTGTGSTDIQVNP